MPSEPPTHRNAPGPSPAPRGEPPARGWPNEIRLRRHADFQRAYRAGRRRRSPHFLWVVWRPAPAMPRTRLGIAVSRKSGGAVVRNRLKRRTRELLRLTRAACPTGWEVVVLPQASVLRASFAELQIEVRSLWGELARQGGGAA